MTEGDRRKHGSHLHDDHHQTKDTKISLYSPYKQRQTWNDDQILPHVNWGALFFDLFYVSMAYNLSSVLIDSPSSRGVLYFIGAFLPCAHIWFDDMYFVGRFTLAAHNSGGGDVYHRATDVAQYVALATAVLHIRPVSIMSDLQGHVDMFAFCAAYSSCRLLNLLRYAEVYLFGVAKGPEMRPNAVSNAKTSFLPTTISLIATIFTGNAYFGDHSSSSSWYDDHRYQDVPIWLCLVSCLTKDFTYLFLPFFESKETDFKKHLVPMNVDFAIHRLGEWVMLMLGESILSLLIVDTSEHYGHYYSTFYGGVLTVVLLQYQHFQSQPHKASDHAIRRDRSASILYMFLNFYYSAALVALGASYKMILKGFTYTKKEEEYDEYASDAPYDRFRRLAKGDGYHGQDDNDAEERVARLFCVSTALAWFVLDAMTLTHKGVRANLNRCRCEKSGSPITPSRLILLVARIGIVCFVATLDRYVTEPEVLVLVGLAGTIAQVVLRVLGDFHFALSKVDVLRLGSRDENKNHDVKDVENKGDVANVRTTTTEKEETS